ncbi:prepilin peptidase [Candidatus Parcubacteria bacterium]|nr:prepilin peptidase [Candidatus Parcubacteria bacterium]
MFYFILFLVFVFGAVIGSFLNCLIWRLHKKKTILGRSICLHCRKQIAWYDNIPLLSFIILRGKCRHCAKKISWQYPAVEFVTGVLFVIAFLGNQESGIRNQGLFVFNFSLIPNSLFFIHLIRDWFIVSVMIIIFIYDLRWYLILDIITLPACAVVFIFNLLLGFNWQNLLISGIIGGSFFLLQFAVSRGKWIGGGDIRLGLLMGLALGWPMILTALYIAYISGSVIGIYLLAAKKKQWGGRIPFGVFLTTATVISLFWGDELVSFYWGLFI